MAETKVYSDRLNSGIDGAKILAGSIPGSALAPGAAIPPANSITSAMLTTGVAGSGLTGGAGSPLSVVVDGLTLHITSNTISVLSVGSSQIANAAITPALLASSVAGNGLSGGAGSALTVNFDNSSVDLNGSFQLEVKAGGITSAKLASGAVNGSTSNTGTQQQISQGTVSTPDLRANAITQIQQTGTTGASNLGAADNALQSKSITTTGGPVLVMATWNMTTSHFVTGFVYRGTIGAATAFPANYASFDPSGTGGASIESGSVSIISVDTPPAGTYTYTQGYNSSNLSVTFNTINLVLIELKR